MAWHDILNFPENTVTHSIDSVNESGGDTNFDRGRFAVAAWH